MYYRWYCGAPSLPSLTSLASSSRWFSFANNTKMPQTPANSRNEIYEALKELWFLDNTDNIFKSRYFFVCATTNKKNTTLNYIWKSCYKSGAKFTKLTVHTEMRSKLWLCQLRVSFISFFNIRWTTKIKITTQIVLTKHITALPLTLLIRKCNIVTYSLSFEKKWL